MEIGVPVAIIVVVFGLIGWLLSNKDKKQAEEIAKLFDLHKEDSDKLAALQLYIAGKHYERHELDGKFDKLDNSIQSGFQGLRSDMKEMMIAFNSHVNEDRKGSQ